MQVHLPTGETLTRYQDLNDWINEAERVFGKHNQRAFWEYCYQVSHFVWDTSLKQLSFPPSRMRDIFLMIKNFRPVQLRYAPLAFFSMKKLLKKYDLLANTKFVDFINEQLLITAQNKIEEVNILFGCTALCYTNYGNYYVEGGLINLVRPLCEYIKNQGNTILTRTEVTAIRSSNEGYNIEVKHRNKDYTVAARHIVSGIPLNNTLELWKAGKTPASDHTRGMTVFITKFTLTRHYLRLIRIVFSLALIILTTIFFILKKIIILIQKKRKLRLLICWSNVVFCCAKISLIRTYPRHVHGKAGQAESTVL